MIEKYLSVLLGSAWGRLGGYEYQGMHKQMFRSGFNPAQIAIVKLCQWWLVVGWWLFLVLPLYWVWQWAMIQAFPYGANNWLRKLLSKIFGGVALEYMQRLICAMFWCLPPILFTLFAPFWHWGLYYIISITLIPVIGTFIKSADWNEMSVWGVFSTQVFI